MTRSRSGSRLVYDWDFYLKNSGKEFAVSGDRNSMRNACAQYFKRKGKDVEVRSRTFRGIAYLKVVRVR